MSQTHRRADQFITAAFGRYKGAGARLRRQAENLGIATQTRLYDMKSLTSAPAFWSTHGDLMQTVPSGWFVWKPFVILSAMATAKDGDILIYCDAGCELNPQGRAQLNHWLDIVADKDLVLFSTGCKWEDYCKAFTTAHFQAQPALRDMPDSVSAGILFVRVSARTRQFVQQWYELCGQSNYQLSDNNSYGMAEPANFVAHRHDQSILHHLVLRSALDIEVLGESLWRADWREAEDLPILAIRNRFRFSVLQTAVQKNIHVLPLWKKVLSKLFTEIQGHLR